MQSFLDDALKEAPKDISVHWYEIDENHHGAILIFPDKASYEKKPFTRKNTGMKIRKGIWNLFMNFQDMLKQRDLHNENRMMSDFEFNPLERNFLIYGLAERSYPVKEPIGYRLWIVELIYVYSIGKKMILNEAVDQKVLRTA